MYPPWRIISSRYMTMAFPFRDNKSSKVDLKGMQISISFARSRVLRRESLGLVRLKGGSIGKSDTAERPKNLF